MVEMQVSRTVGAAPAETFHWFSRFRAYPEFMSAVNHVEQDRGDPRKVHWIFSMAGMMRHYTTEVDVDDETRELSWRSMTGADHSGQAWVTELDDGTSRLDLWLEFHPRGAVEQLAESIGSIKRRLNRELGHFATYVEYSGQVSPVGRRTADPDTPSDQSRSYSERLADLLFGTDGR